MIGRSLVLLVLVAPFVGAQIPPEDPPAEERAFLGIYMNADHSVLAGRGIAVTGVFEESGAGRAGLAMGDVLRTFAGVEVRTTAALAAAIQSRQPGAEVEIVLWRDGQEKTVEATLGPWPAEIPESAIEAIPDPLDETALVAEVGAMRQAFLAGGEADRVAARAERLRGYASLYRSCAVPDLAAEVRPAALERVAALVEDGDWYAALAGLGVRLPVNPVGPEGNALRRIPELVDGLDSEDFEVRDRAMNALADIGAAAREELEKAARSDDLELSHRAREILDRIEGGPDAIDGAVYRLGDVRVSGVEGDRFEFVWRRGRRDLEDAPVEAVVVRGTDGLGTCWLLDLTEGRGRVEGLELAAGDRLLWIVRVLE